MPRRSSAKVTGVCGEGSGLGNLVDSLLRERCPPPGKSGAKVGRLALYQKRKSEIRAGAKLPENMRRASIRFGQLAEDIRATAKCTTGARATSNRA